MKRSNLIAIPGFREESSQFNREDYDLVIYGLRIALLGFSLFLILLAQTSQPEFINLGVWLPIYFFFSASFLCHSFFSINYNIFSRNLYLQTSLFFVDSLLFASFLFYINVNQSIFIFLFLLNIAFAGLLFERKASMTVALWTSFLFSCLLAIKPALQGTNIYLTLTLNNIAFFTVAWLSGQIKGQLQSLDQEVQVKGRSITALKELNEMIVENVGTGLITVDRNRYITHANKAALKIIESVSLRGQQLDKILPHVTDKMKLDMFKRTPDPVVRYETDYENSSNFNQTLEVIVSPLKNPLGQESGFVLMIQDLTELKRMESVMRQQEKLAAVGQLAAGIAHEIRNPLASISGSIQLLESSLPSESEEAQKLLNIVLREIDRLNGLITEFLEFVRPEVKADESLDLNQLINEVLDMANVNTNLRQNVSQKRMLKAQRTILGHHDKLKQALLNIVINAYQALEEESSPELVVQTYDEGGFVVLSIKDNGQGMDQEGKERIFEPFHTTKPKGTGLGLAITHKILEVHKASVYVESELNKGTVFTIQFPAGSEFFEGHLKFKKRA